MFAHVIAALSIVLLLSAPATARSDELADAYARGLDLFRAQNYQQALPYFQEALALAEERYGTDDPKLAVELNIWPKSIGSWAIMNRPSRSIDGPLALDEANLATDDPDLATSLNNLALLYRAQDRLDEAEALYERSLDILQDALGPRHPNVAKSLNNLAVLYDAQGRRVEAATLIERAVDIAAETLGEEHPTTITLASNLESIGGSVAASGEVVAQSGDTPPTPAPSSEPPPLPDLLAEEDETVAQPIVAAAAPTEPVAESSPKRSPNSRPSSPQRGVSFSFILLRFVTRRSPPANGSGWWALWIASGFGPRGAAKVTTDSGEFYRVWAVASPIVP